MKIKHHKRNSRLFEKHSGLGSLGRKSVGRLVVWSWGQPLLLGALSFVL